ncbi:MAG TPA: multiheme c-type cytochrome [Sphingomonadaceae bacterium]|nr:multiheme c-type cytochrome [Sphingomonadaceae bacterium]
MSGGKMARGIARTAKAAGGAIAALCLLALAFTFGGDGEPAIAATASPALSGVHLGVASCAGSTCHGRSEPTGAIVRQDEMVRWQEPSSPSGAHSRAFAVLSGPRSRDIARRLGLASAASAPMCLGCHAEPAGPRGPRFQQSDGVGCESCHGPASGWIEVHKTGNRAAALAAGLVPLDQPKRRAALCLDCHFGNDRPGQFVSHRIMAAGHPRVSFELDLFSTLQAHHDEDADYARRKGRTDHVRLWAVGQAMAIDRALSLFLDSRLAQDGLFPEFYFFDCHTCHRRITDDADFRATAVANPGRPIPSGMPAFNDENMIMLSAAARVAAPDAAARFDADSKAFHAALARDRASAVTAAAALRASANALGNRFAARTFRRDETFAMLDAIASTSLAPRFTDYEGSVQAVMAADTLLNALVDAGYVGAESAKAVRGQINLAYAAVKDPNRYRPLEFRAALARAAGAIRALR